MSAKRQRFDSAGFERQASKILTRLNRGGHFEPLKRLMRAKLARVGWKHAFCQLSFISEVFTPANDRDRRRRTMPLASIQSICSLNDKISGTPLVSAREEQGLRRGRMSNLRRSALARRIEAQEMDPRYPRSVDVVFLPAKIDQRAVRGVVSR